MLHAAVFILGRVLMAAGSPAPPRISFVLCFLLLGAACSGFGRLFSRVFLVCAAVFGGARGARRRFPLFPRPYSRGCVRAFPPKVGGFAPLGLPRRPQESGKFSAGFSRRKTLFFFSFRRVSLPPFGWLLVAVGAPAHGGRAPVPEVCTHADWHWSGLTARFCGGSPFSPSANLPCGMQKKCLGARGARVRVGLAFDARTARTGGVYGGAPCRACAAPPCVNAVFAPSFLRLCSVFCPLST